MRVKVDQFSVMLLLLCNIDLALIVYVLEIYIYYIIFPYHLDNRSVSSCLACRV